MTMLSSFLTNPFEGFELPSLESNSGKYISNTSSTVTWTTPVIPPSVEPGTISFSASSTAPPGWMACNGAFVPVASYPNLEGILQYKPPLYGNGIGAQYGPGSGFSYSANNNLGDGRVAAQAFNGTNINGEVDCFHSSYVNNLQSTPVELTITCPSPIVFARYYLSGRPYNDYLPASWTIQGSTNGTSWTTLDTRTGQTITYGTAVTSAMTEYTFSNTTAYSYYKISITAINYGISGYVVIGEMAFEQPLSGPDTTQLTLPTISNLTYGQVTTYAYIKN